ncbi:MAG: tripartite tricarboxylate transporter substrate binding protein [Bacillota bacterium]
MNFKKFSAIMIILVLVFTFISGCSTQPAQEKKAEPSTEKSAEQPAEKKSSYPDKPITIIAASNAGGGWDLTARNSAKVLNEEKIVSAPIKVQNIVGGGGSLGFQQFVENHKADPYTLIATSAAMIANPVAQGWPYDHNNITPLARLFVDYEMLVAKKGSKWDSAEKLFEALKNDPKSITIGGETPPGTDYIAFVMALVEKGIDVSQINWVSYEGAGEAIPALLGGHIDVSIATAGEWVSQIKSGQLQGIGIFSEERLEGELNNIPTMREQGINVVFGNWRGLWGPPNMPKAEYDYWVDALTKMNESQAWKDVLTKMQWVPWFKTDNLDQWLDGEKENMVKAMKAAGILK